MELSEMTERLRAFVDETFDAESVLGEVVESDGHAGLTYLFDVHQRDSDVVSARYVIKIPPSGVRLKGNTDVMRQAPLLRALKRSGLPVPDVPFAFAESSWFDRPFIVMERLPGRVFFIWNPHRSFELTPAAVASIWRQCVERLASLHQFEWRAELSDWEPAEPLIDNVTRWRRIYEHALEPIWQERAEQVEALLLKTIPSEYRVGLFHGDYQPGNLLYDGTRLTGIIDWELAGISAQLLDVGWLMMVCDPNNWGDSFRPIQPPAPELVKDTYQRAMGETFAELDWFQAFAGFRLASIACLNVKLHHTGRRHDPVWEEMGRRVLSMLSRAEQLLGA